MISSRRYSVVVDTNIFLSGILFGGTPGKIIVLLKKKTIIPLISPELRYELIEKLREFNVSDLFLADILHIFDEGGKQIIPKKRVSVCRDPDDNMLLELAQAGYADFLVTGDKDVLVLGEFEKTVILNPRDFMAQIVT